MRLLLMAALAAVQATGLSPIFDDGTARELMQLRRAFDAEELAAIRAFDAAVGAGARVAVPTGHYRNQRATPAVDRHPWTAEQKRRAAAAWPVRRQRIDDAEAQLGARTTAILKRHGYTADYLPPVRRRKWDGPAEFAFDGHRGTVPAESRALLQEVRRLWALSARNQ